MTDESVSQAEASTGTVELDEFESLLQKDFKPRSDEAREQIAYLEDRMGAAADNLEFELAADIRDRIRELRQEFGIREDDEGSRGDDGVDPGVDPLDGVPVDEDPRQGSPNRRED
jgi:excinuclease ABC subunit B